MVQFDKLLMVCIAGYCLNFSFKRRDEGHVLRRMLDLTRFNKIAIQGAPQMAVDKEAISLSRVYSTHTILSVTCPYSMCNPL